MDKRCFSGIGMFFAPISDDVPASAALQTVLLKRVTHVADLEVLCLRRDDLSGTFSAVHALQQSRLAVHCQKSAIISRSAFLCPRTRKAGSSNALQARTLVPEQT